MPKLPTASRLSIARHCIWPWWSPDAKWSYDRSDATDRGSLFHAYVAEQVKIPGERRTLAQILAGLEAFAQEQGGTFHVGSEDFRLVERWIEAWERDAAPMLAGVWTAETLLAYDPAKGTARELPAGTHPRFAWKVTKKGELTGAADVHMFPDADTVTVIDWKTGRIDNVEQARENAQMRFLGLAAARAFGRKRAIVMLAYVSEEGVQAEPATLGPDDFAATEQELRGVVARIAAHDPPCPGSHCRWCPARASCPETERSIVAVAPMEQAVFKVGTITTDAGSITGPDHAAWMLRTIRRVRLAADDVEAALRTYADDHGGIPSDGGKTWARHEINVQRIALTPDAEQMLRDELPEALTVSASKSSIESAARKRKLPIAKTREDMIAKLVEQGAVSTSTTVKYEDR